MVVKKGDFVHVKTMSGDFDGNGLVVDVHNNGSKLSILFKKKNIKVCEGYTMDFRHSVYVDTACIQNIIGSSYYDVE